MAESESQGMETVRVPMVGPEIVKQLRALHALGWGSKRIAQELGISRNSVRRCVREGAVAEAQVRPKARTLDDAQRALAQQLLDGPAQGNGVVVQRPLAGASLPGPPRRGRAKEAPDAPSATQRRTRHRRPRARPSRRAG